MTSAQGSRPAREAFVVRFEQYLPRFMSTWKRRTQPRLIGYGLEMQHLGFRVGPNL